MLAEEREKGMLLLWPCRGSCCWIQDPCPAGNFVEQILNSYGLLVMSSVTIKLKQVGEVSLSSMQWKMHTASMFGFVWIQSIIEFITGCGN